MNRHEDETLHFRAYRTLDGTFEEISGVFLWNKRPVPQFCTSLLACENTISTPEASQEFLDEICYNLTLRQRVVWLTLLDSPSIAEAARRLAMTGPAVHDFIRRMARRNVFVRYWRWRHRNRSREPGSHAYVD